MIFAKVNDMKVSARIGTSILDACSLTGVSVPRFCYHEILSISGNCRMCLVEVEGLDKPIASCLSQIYNDISVYTDSPFVKKARENVLETLLINHPLDCPICDQAGECDLQDQSELFGGDTSRFSFNKRSVEDKYCGPFIKTIMTRCIHCTRCVRYASEIGGIRSFGTLSRGVSTEIGGYLSHVFKSEISGNVIDLCPVGALNLKPNAFKSRSWELRCSESIDTSDCLGSNIYVHSKESSIFRILPKVNSKINGSIISDKARFLYDSPKKKSNKIPPFLHCKKYKKVQKFKFLG